MASLVDGDLLSDESLREAFLTPVRKCADYKPAFGQGGSGGISYSAFERLYGEDQFYSWLGLNDPMMYAAHRAAGGITSVYRQIGIGSERLVRQVMRGRLRLSSDQLDWSYKYEKPRGDDGVHTLDAKLELDDLTGEDADRAREWLHQATEMLGTTQAGRLLKGAVFEVRQGYKSADSKRQNADLRFGMRAYQALLLPVVLVLSSQVSAPVIARYRADGMLVLTGLLDDDPLISSWAFLDQVVGYDLAAFFKRNSDALRGEVTAILGSLLTAE